MKWVQKLGIAWITAGGLLELVRLYRRSGRAWVLNWGATRDEAGYGLPGDELIAAPAGQATRAVTINAPVGCVWPWLAQMGQGRGGAYTYDWIENLFGLGMHSADRILPELQQLQ